MFFPNFQRCIGWLSLLALLGGCGGSTQGTGGITVEGRLLELSGAPISGASVVLVTSGDATTTNASGSFLLVSPSPQIELLFESGETSAATALPVTAETRKVVATFKLDRERRRVETDDITIEADDDSRDDNEDPVVDDSGDDNGGDDDPSDDGGDGVDDGDDEGDDNSGVNDGTDDGDSPDDDGIEDEDDDESGSGNSGDEGDLRREARGTLEVISSSEVVVDGVRFRVRPSSEYRDANGDSVTAGYFMQGMEVKARGVVAQGVLVLVRLESEED